MSRIFLTLNTDKLKKLNETSEYFKGLKSYSQSDYWRIHESLSAHKFNSSGVFISGQSGHYYPHRKTFYNIIKAKLNRMVKSIAFKACREILYLSRSSQRGQLPAVFFPYADAYDVVWSMASYIYDNNGKRIIRCSENREILDFRNVQIPEEFKNHKLLQRNWHLKDRFLLEGKFFLDFYNYFVTRHFCQKPNRILEIGPGNGNLASIFHYYFKNHITLIDIPSVMISAIAFLSYVFPDARMLYPQDLSQDKDLNAYHFCFLLPDQIGILNDNFFDLAVNNGSFQEMTIEQIREYFNLIYRVLRDGGFFSTLNRVEKVVSKDTKPIRFSDYPYTFPNEVLLNEIDPFMKLVQRDNCIHKIVRIIKR